MSVWVCNKRITGWWFLYAAIINEGVTVANFEEKYGIKLVDKNIVNIIEEIFGEEIKDKLNNLPWGRKAVRLVIGIGDNNDYDAVELLKFSNQPEIGVLEATSAAKLTAYIKWASTTATITSVASKSKHFQDNAESEGNIFEANVTPPPDVSDGLDVF